MNNTESSETKHMDETTKQRIEQQIKDNRVMVFIKGTSMFPQCGFSGQVVQILQGYGTEFGECNVLDDDAIREGIKQYSNWPTIPQLYVDGEFIGGCDILMQMHASGELGQVLEPVKQ